MLLARDILSKERMVEYKIQFWNTEVHKKLKYTKIPIPSCCKDKNGATQKTFLKNLEMATEEMEQREIPSKKQGSYQHISAQE